MRVLVTGASGFVGGWLTRELAAAGHEIVAAPPSRDLDIADVAAVQELVREAEPDVIAHLAAVASWGGAGLDPARATRTIIGGTVAVAAAAAGLDPRPGLLAVSSAEVYAAPADGDPALTEAAPLVPRSNYGLLKLAQEAVAITAALRDDLPLVVARPFNHVGPGQPPVSATASFAQRVDAVRRGETNTLSVGNLDVERDIGDVRDVVVAYRLLLEALADGRLGRPSMVFNVATGHPVRLRWIVDELCRLASVEPEIRIDPQLVREGDPPRLAGDAGALRAATGWEPRIELRRTLTDMLAEHGDG